MQMRAALDLEQFPDSPHATELREAIHALGIMHEDSATAPFVTASVGVAVVRPRLGRSPERCRADR
jgi:PleD family two-component response regulator